MAASAQLGRICCVEDEPDVCFILELVLGQMGGLIVETYANGAEALEKAPMFNPDLIILDVLMPGIDGIETFKRMRQIPMLATTPVILMTARVMPYESVAYRSLDVAAIIAKPFDPLSLPDQIRAAWQTANGLPQG